MEASGSLTMTSQRTDHVRCLEGFAWAVPTAFARGLGACYFDEGDTLYDSRRAYTGVWGTSLPTIGRCVRVKSTGLASVVGSSVQQESVFARNWLRPVELELIDFKCHQTTAVSCTQGRLYTLLWKGDLDILEEHTPEPEVPRLPMSTVRGKLLGNAVSQVRSRLAAKLHQPVVFIMPYDETHAVLVDKEAGVRTSLSKSWDPIRIELSPNVLQQPGPEFVPTLTILCFAVDCRDPSRVEEALKQALYVPAKDKKTAKESFKVSAHGHLQAL